MQSLKEKKANMVGIPMKKIIFTSEQRELRWSSFKNADPESMFELSTKPMVDWMTVFDHMEASRRRCRCICRLHEQGDFYHSYS